MLLMWDDLPDYMRTKEVEPYFAILQKKKGALVLKRIFDVSAATFMSVVLAVPMLAIAIAIKIDSEGPILFRQERVTAYGKVFKIHKFRTMVDKGDSIGPGVTTQNDHRVTNVGSFLRKYRLDEFPQLFDVLAGDMSFVGTRPESVKYVNQYTPSMYATLLMPAGITSEASIRYKDEAEILSSAEDADRAYIEEVLPEKMKYNLKTLEEFSLRNEFLTLVKTVFAVIGVESI